MLGVKPRNMLTQLGEPARLGFFTHTGLSTYCFASDFVRQERLKIPSHQTACHTSLEADHDVGSERELRCPQALIQVPAAASTLSTNPPDP